jgi:hypothetical protein
LLNTDSRLSIVAQVVVAVVLIAGASLLAYVDPAVRDQMAGAFLVGVGAAVSFFFNQRATAAGSTQALNGMSHMASLIAAGTPGPAGPAGPAGTSVGEMV